MLQVSAKLLEINDGHASVAVAPDIGGAIAWFRWHQNGNTLDWFRPYDAQVQDQSDAGALASFPLVPYSNRIHSGHFQFSGHAVQLPSSAADPHFEHGHGWRQRWSVESHDQSRIVLIYRHQPDSWPWAYEARQEIRLVDGALEVSLSLHNLSDTTMPAGFGLHPFFPASASTRLEADLSAMWEVDSEVLPTQLVPLTERRQVFDIEDVNFDNVFCGWSRRARIVWPDKQATLDIIAEAPLDFLVLYTPQGEGYFCAEPVSNATDAFNLATQGRTDTGMISLVPGATCSATTRFIPQTEIVV